jgi:hypothetical protein
MINILEYRKSFYPVSIFFVNMMRQIETQYDLWENSADHVEQLLKETILDLACRLQDSTCLRNASSLWPTAHNGLVDNSQVNNISPHVRSVVYNYHFQNTYDVNDYSLVLMQYNVGLDIQEHRRLLEALTFSRLPWMLADFFEQDLELIDFEEGIRLLSVNPLGRELMWDFVRLNYAGLLEFFGLEDPRLGQMLIDISRTFENEFIFYELIIFVFNTANGASEHARFKALEIVSTNTIWLEDKELEIEDAFTDPRYNKIDGFVRTKVDENRKPFQIRVKEFMETKFGPDAFSNMRKLISKKN